MIEPKCHWSGVLSALPAKIEGADTSTTVQDWTKPAAMAIPKEGFFELERGRYGPVFPRTPACYGFSIIAKVKEGREDAIREHGKTIQAPKRRSSSLHYACTTSAGSSSISAMA